jgi:DnaJ-domain-containing protein 1
MKFTVNPFFWQRQALKKHPDIRRCDYQDCQEEGTYRAPRHDRKQDIKNNSNWHWLCLDHVRTYNSSWNFYKNMSEDEINASRRRDAVWERVSWPLGDINARAASKPFLRSEPFTYNRKDPFGFFGDPYDGHWDDRVFTAQERAAIALLGLSLNYSQDDLHKAYRGLVKIHHPDLNGGSADAENKIKSINVAYELLKNKQE